MLNVLTQPSGSGPRDKSVAGELAVAPQEHLPVFDESNPSRPVPKPPLDIAAQVIAGAHERQLGPRDIVRADARLDLPGQRTALAAQRLVLSIIEQVRLIRVVPAHEASERHRGQGRVGALP